MYSSSRGTHLMTNVSSHAIYPLAKGIFFVFEVLPALALSSQFNLHLIIDSLHADPSI